MTKNRIITTNVTYDPYDNIHYIVCPKCGDYITIVQDTPNICSCNRYWKIVKAAVGKLYIPQENEE